MSTNQGTSSEQKSIVKTQNNDDERNYGEPKAKHIRLNDNDDD